MNDGISTEASRSRYSGSTIGVLTYGPNEVLTDPSLRSTKSDGPKSSVFVPRGAGEAGSAAICEEDGDVVGVVTPLVRGGAQILHGDQVVELSVLLEVHEREEKGEDGEEQIEVEEERGELKEKRTCTWMT